MIERALSLSDCTGNSVVDHHAKSVILKKTPSIGFSHLLLCKPLVRVIGGIDYFGHGLTAAQLP